MTQPGYGHMRASDAERERAVDVLKAAFTEGRLTQDEYTERVGQVQVSHTYGALAELLHDLPVGPFGSLPPPPAPAYPAYPAYPGYASYPPALAHPGYPPALARPGYPPTLPYPPAASYPPGPALQPGPGPGYLPASGYGPVYPPSSVYAPVYGPSFPLAGPYQPPLVVPRQRDALAVTSVAVALAALTFPPAAVAAVGLGIAALARIRRTGQLGQNFAIAGIALGTFLTLIFIALIVPALTGG